MASDGAGVSKSAFKLTLRFVEYGHRNGKLHIFTRILLEWLGMVAFPVSRCEVGWSLTLVEAVKMDRLVH